MAKNKQPLIVPLVLCGGEGRRLAPLSTPECPKPFLTIFDGQSLFQQTILRCKNSLFSAPVISCQQSHVSLVQEQLEALGTSEYTLIAEPAACNTAPAIITATHIVARTQADAYVLVMPADHYVEDASALYTAVKKAIHSARAGNIVTFGITPTHAETRFGYIEQGAKSATGCYSVKQFIEKPSAEVSRLLIQEGKSYWNSGMFFFDAAQGLKLMAHAAPNLYAHCKEIMEKTDGKKKEITLPDEYRQCENIAFDYAVMEHITEIEMLPLNMPWNDVGDWPALLDVLGIKRTAEQENTDFYRQVAERLLKKN